MEKHIKSLVLTLVVPILTILIMVGVHTYEQIKLIKDSENIEKEILRSTKFAELLHFLQAERGASVGFLSNQKNAFEQILKTQREQSDIRLKKTIEEFDSLHFIKDEVEKIRKKVDNSKINLFECIDEYTKINEYIIISIKNISKQSSIDILTKMLNSYTNFIYAKENAGLERAFGVAIVAQNLKDPVILEKFYTYSTSKKVFTKSFEFLADEDFIKKLNLYQNNKIHNLITNIERDIVLNENYTDAAHWFKITTYKINQLKDVEDFISQKIINASNGIVYDIKRNSFLLLVINGIIILFAILMVYFILRKINLISTELREKIEIEIQKNSQKDKMMIEQARQATMGEMIGNIAHQWRQPLNALSLVVQKFKLLNDFGKLSDEEIEKNVAKGSEIIQSMSKTIDDFRNFFKPHKEKIPFGLYETVKSSINILEAALLDKNIKLNINIDSKTKVFGYPNEFMQVILNIISNAKDVLIERNMQNSFIEINSKETNKYVELTIEDSAGGIDEKIINRIFDPYFTTKEEGKGTGIGLYMSKTIIEKHMEGKLSVYNGKFGAVFSIKMHK